MSFTPNDWSSYRFGLWKSLYVLESRLKADVLVLDVIGVHYVMFRFRLFVTLREVEKVLRHYKPTKERVFRSYRGVR